MKGRENKINFIESLNKALSSENAALERLSRRIQQTLIQDSKNTLQEQKNKDQQNGLNLISVFNEKPISSKADQLSLNSSSEEKNNIVKDKNTYTNIITKLLGQDLGPGSNNDKNDTSVKEGEILNTKEEVLIKNIDICYKMVLKIAEGMRNKDAKKKLKQNLQEKQSMYNKMKNAEPKMLNEIGENNDYHGNSFKLGAAVADMLTSYWNLKENPSKVYLFNRRVHHGAIGVLLGLSTLYKKNPIATGILAGLGAGLRNDDYNDIKEWFLFKEREDDVKGNK